MKSMTLMNWTAPSRNNSFRSEMARGIGGKG
jgi:hypothetical protein